MKKLLFIPIFLLVLSCGSNGEQSEKEKILKQLEINQKENERLSDRLKMIDLEIESLNLEDDGSEKYKKERKELLNEMNIITEKMKTLLYEDSVLLTEIKQ